MASHMSPDAREALLEVMARRYYRIRELTNLRRIRAAGTPMVAAEYAFAGDRILRMERQPVESLDDASRLLEGYESDTLLLLVKSGELTSFVVLER